MPDGDSTAPAGMLRASVAAGVSGPVVILSGETDLTSTGQLSALITAQLSGGTRQLTVDVSGLRFADTASIRTLVLAARTLKERGGSLVLLRPQPPLARMLDLLGAAQMFTIRREIYSEPGSEDRAV
jgi:stage II sporulation protein AA (anti-sigma F factor antagonist)